MFLHQSGMAVAARKIMKTLVMVLLLAATAVHAGPGNKSQQVGLLAEIHFSEGSARLPEGSGSQLGQIAAWAEENFDGLIVLDGHADHRGKAAHNIRLSLRRARLVRDQLIALGVDPDQIIIAAFNSEQRPRARVAVWGTHNSLEQVIAKRQGARAMVWGDGIARPMPRSVRRR